MTWGDAQRVDLAAAPSSVGEARRFVRHALAAWHLEGVVDTVTLLTSELATNAVVHAGTAFAVLVARDDNQVLVEVLDGSVSQPHAQRPGPEATNGRGVGLVDALASAWGVTPADRLGHFAKGVWFTVPVAGVEESVWDGDWLADL